MNRIQQLLKNSDNISFSDIDLLQDEIQKFPYFQALRFIYLKAIKKHKPQMFQEELAKNAIYFPYKTFLFEAFHNEGFILYENITKSKFIAENSSSEIEIIVENQKVEEIIEKVETENTVTEIREVTTNEPTDEYYLSLKKLGLEHIYFEEKAKEQNETLEKVIYNQEEKIEENSSSEIEIIVENQKVEEIVEKVETKNTDTEIREVTTNEPTDEYYLSLKKLGLEHIYFEEKAKEQNETLEKVTDSQEEKIEEIIAENSSSKIKAIVENQKVEEIVEKVETKNTDTEIREVTTNEPTDEYYLSLKKLGLEHIYFEEKAKEQNEALEKVTDNQEEKIEEIIAENSSSKIKAIVENQEVEEIVEKVETENTIDESITENLSFVLDKEEKIEEIQPQIPEKLSFSDWLKISGNIAQSSPIKKIPKEKQEEIIDKFIEENPKIKQIQSNENSEKEYHFIIQKEEISHLMTETLANLYIEQGKNSLAIKALSILSLKFPEKSRYFANRIKELKNK